MFAKRLSLIRLHVHHRRLIVKYDATPMNEIPLRSVEIDCSALAKSFFKKRAWPYAFAIVRAGRSVRTETMAAEDFGTSTDASAFVIIIIIR